MRKTARRRPKQIVSTSEDQRDAALNQMKKGKRLHDALRELEKRVGAWNLPGEVTIRRGTLGSSLSVYVQRSWSVEASFQIDFVVRPEATLVDPATNNHYTPFDHETRLSWSSTHRTIPQALAAANLYRELIDLAADLEAMLSSFGQIVAVEVDED